MMKWHEQMPKGKRWRFVAVVGPTASGKSFVGMELAKAFQGTIICCDSVQLYRGFDIGSAKPSAQDQARVPHLLFDQFAWDEVCDAAIYARLARAAITDVVDAGRLPIVVGGTGLYLRALIGELWDDDVPSDEGLRQRLAIRQSADLYAELRERDPRRAGQLHENDRFRVIRALEINFLTGAPVRDSAASTRPPPPRDHLLVFMNPPRDALYANINDRVRSMLSGGLIDEVRGLLDAGVDPSCKVMGSIGYKEVFRMLSGHLPVADLERDIATATRQYAKRQVTWFKKIAADAVLSETSDVTELLSTFETLGFRGEE